jgi:hypothetical protein
MNYDDVNVPAPESLIQPQAGMGSYDDEVFDSEGTLDPAWEEKVTMRLTAIEEALAAQAKITEGIRTGVNTIGEMMNGVADAFGQMMEQVNKGGIGALLGGMMGGKKNDN